MYETQHDRERQLLNEANARHSAGRRADNSIFLTITGLTLAGAVAAWLVSVLF